MQMKMKSFFQSSEFNVADKWHELIIDVKSAFIHRTGDLCNVFIMQKVWLGFCLKFRNDLRHIWHENCRMSESRKGNDLINWKYWWWKESDGRKLFWSIETRRGMCGEELRRK
jgi:hypothetical protein